METNKQNKIRKTTSLPPGIKLIIFYEANLNQTYIMSN